MYGKDYLIEAEAEKLAEVVRRHAKAAYRRIHRADPEVAQRAVAKLGGNVVLAEENRRMARTHAAHQQSLLQQQFATNASAGRPNWPFEPLPSVLSGVLGIR